MTETANEPFRGGAEERHNPFAVGAEDAANEDVPRSTLTIDRVEDLVVDLGNGNEESVSYRLYTGSSLIRKGCVLVVRFATRHVFIEGARLRPLRDAISNKRCRHLRISSRMETINAQKDGGPVISALRVVKPSAGDQELEPELAESSPGEALRPS